MTLSYFAAFLGLLAALLAILAAAGAAFLALRTERRMDECRCRLSGFGIRLSALSRRLEEQKSRLEELRDPEKPEDKPMNEEPEERRAQRWMQGIADILSYTGEPRRKEGRSE